MEHALILASASPRRRELLTRLGVDFRVVPAGVDEKPQPNEAPQALTARLAEAKARTVEADGPVLAADTVVALDGDVLGKPRDAAGASAMLERLAGREHRVVTALVLLHEGALRRATIVSRVWFRALEEAEREAYAARDEALDAAGGYAIQGGAAAFVTRLAGSYSNVVGLPLAETARLLDAAGSSA